MENQSQEINASAKTASPAIESTDLQVAGNYQLFEYQKIDGDKKLIALPITVVVKQRPDLLTVELFNETDKATTLLTYPMNGASVWNEERKAFVFTRAKSDSIVADVVYPASIETRSTRTTFRITWRKDDKGSIIETFEDFDADGNRLESSLGHFRTLVPILET